MRMYASHSATGDPTEPNYQLAPCLLPCHPAWQPGLICWPRSAAPKSGVGHETNQNKTLLPRHRACGSAKGADGGDYTSRNNTLHESARLMVYRSSPRNESMTHVPYPPMLGQGYLVSSCNQDPRVSRAWLLPALPVLSRRAAGHCGYGMDMGQPVASPAHAANDFSLRVPVLLALA